MLSQYKFQISIHVVFIIESTLLIIVQNNTY